ncbi:MAG: sel1 repeat family protein [Clostridia bacterium]|nr:sel1 repeat family protein [Clostridia bacterium]
MADDMWLKKAMEGDAYAQYWVGVDYMDGANGVKKDPVEAAYWFEKAAKQGNKPACYAIGYMYYFGEYVLQDYEKAKYYLLRSANPDDYYVQKTIKDCDEHLNK